MLNVKIVRNWVNPKEAELFQCSICTQVFTDPETTQCGHTFCSHCLLLRRQTSSECSICQCRDQRTTKVCLIRKQVDRLELACQFCEESMKNSEYLPHLTVFCEKVPLTCSTKGCAFTGNRIALQNHAPTCQVNSQKEKALKTDSYNAHFTIFSLRSDDLSFGSVIFGSPKNAGNGLENASLSNGSFQNLKKVLGFPSGALFGLFNNGTLMNLRSGYVMENNGVFIGRSFDQKNLVVGTTTGYLRYCAETYKLLAKYVGEPVYGVAETIYTTIVLTPKGCHSLTYEKHGCVVPSLCSDNVTRGSVVPSLCSDNVTRGFVILQLSEKVGGRCGWMTAISEEEILLVSEASVTSVCTNSIPMKKQEHIVQLDITHLVKVGKRFCFQNAEGIGLTDENAFRFVSGKEPSMYLSIKIDPKLSQNGTVCLIDHDPEIDAVCFIQSEPKIIRIEIGKSKETRAKWGKEIGLLFTEQEYPIQVTWWKHRLLTLTNKGNLLLLKEDLDVSLKKRNVNF